MFCYCDSPLIKVQATYDKWGKKASEQLDAKTVLIFPDGKAFAEAQAPKEMRQCPIVGSTRSRWARVGMQIAPSIQTPDANRCVPVIIYNWSPSYSLVVRTGDTIVLTLLAWTDALPLIETIPLTADAVTLQMKKGALPQRNGAPFFDPHEMDAQECMELVPYDMLRLKRNNLMVLPVCERPSISDGYVGIVGSIGTIFHDNSARYAYPGSNGSMALEYKVLKSSTLRPGQHIANLDICNALYPLPPYQGELGRQNSIIPARWQ